MRFSVFYKRNSFFIYFVWDSTSLLCSTTMCRIKRRIERVYLKNVISYPNWWSFTSQILHCWVEIFPTGIFLLLWIVENEENYVFAWMDLASCESQCQGFRILIQTASIRAFSSLREEQWQNRFCLIIEFHWKSGKKNTDPFLDMSRMSIFWRDHRKKLPGQLKILLRSFFCETKSKVLIKSQILNQIKGMRCDVEFIPTTFVAFEEHLDDGYRTRKTMIIFLSLELKGKWALSCKQNIND